MVSFVSLFVATVLAYLSHQQRPYRWLSWFVRFMATQAVFDLVYTYTLIRRILSAGGTSPGMLPYGNAVYIAIDAVTGVALLFFAAQFILKLTDVRNPRFHRWALGPAILVGLLTAATYFGEIAGFDPGTLSRPVSGGAYIYLAAVLAIGIRRRDRIPGGPWRKWVTIYLGGAVVWHGWTAMEALFFPVYIPIEPALPLAAITSSLFNVFWAVLVIVPVTAEFRIRSGSGAARGSGTGAARGGGTRIELPESFVQEYALTRREIEILKRVVDGESNRMIADALYISPRTVDTHVQNIFRKCDVSRRAELIALTHRYT
ncbi:MAG: helix-turn-helix transcriptional regulator [Alkalispirochaeta sp.]